MCAVDDIGVRFRLLCATARKWGNSLDECVERSSILQFALIWLHSFSLVRNVNRIVFLVSPVEIEIDKRKMKLVVDKTMAYKKHEKYAKEERSEKKNIIETNLHSNIMLNIRRSS